jgi:hypothetical protein
MEYCSGPTLHEVLLDESVPGGLKGRLITRAAADISRRHRRAEELKDPRLIQEHATTKHLIVQEQRLITFDLENTFSRDIPLREAMAQELSGFLRPLLRRAGPRSGEFLAAFVAGYEDKDRLRAIAQHAVHDRGLSRRLKRWHDRRRRAEWPKTEVLKRVLVLLEPVQKPLRREGTPPPSL